MRAATQPTLRLTIRQSVPRGDVEEPTNDGLDAINADGDVIFDLHRLLSKSTIERGVGESSVVTLRLYGVEIVHEKVNPS